MRRVFFVCVIVVFVALFCSVLAALAQPGSAQSGDAKPDMVLLKRTPSLDGTIETGEWDPFCRVQSEGFSATAYVDWDENNLYIAAQGDKPLDLTATIDACNDGWFHGSDNYLLRVLAGSGASGGGGSIEPALSRHISLPGSFGRRRLGFARGKQPLPELRRR